MRKWMLIVFCLLLATAVSCQKTETAGEEPFAPKEYAATGGQSESVELPEVAPGDTVILELTIYSSRDLFLTGKKPVVVMPPAEPAYEFDKKSYQLAQPRFPMQIVFKITRDAPREETIVKLGLRLTYAYRANNTRHMRNALLEIPLDIKKRTVNRSPKRIRLPIEYFLESTKEITPED